ncbi:MAG: S8 family serine peptidase [Myxococcales bacterium]|nr:S8 family serine peptidase [Myxococcales bacterium]
MKIAGANLPDVGARALEAATGSWSRQAIGLPVAHALTRGSPEVTVAVLDTGVCATHPELEHALLRGFDFVDIIEGAKGFIGDHLGADPAPDDEQGHGTHVAGIIAARGVRAPVGVAPRCKVLPVRVLGTFVGPDGRPVGAGVRDNIDQGLKWAIDQGAHVINMSLGLLADGPGDQPHAAMMDYARRRGVTVVAAVGNDGTTKQYFPSALPHVVAVGAFDRSGAVARFSTRGLQVDVLGPGEEIYSSYADDGYAFASGTSQAAPFVAGVAALLKSYALSIGESLRDPAIKHVLKRTADRPGPAQKTRDAGYGRLNAADALRFLQLQRRESKPRGVRRPPLIEARP